MGDKCPSLFHCKKEVKALISEESITSTSRPKGRGSLCNQHNNDLMTAKSSKSGKRALGITIVAVLMIVFGLAEVATGLTGNFLGIVSTSTATAATYIGVAIGISYVVSGTLVLTMRRRALTVALALLGIDVIGRIALVLTGFYPTNSFKNTFSIIAGTAIVVIFAIYLWIKRDEFSL